MQPALETLARVSGMVEVSGLEEDETIMEAYDLAQKAIDGALHTIHNGDLQSAKTAVEISLNRVRFLKIEKSEGAAREWSTVVIVIVIFISWFHF